MITEKMFYGLKCDRCGKLYVDCNDSSFWNDEGCVIDNACDDDWVVFNGKFYCPDCYMIYGDDKILLLEECPEVLIKLKEFIHSKTNNIKYELVEHDDSFVIKLKYFNEIKQDLFSEEDIKSLVGEKFISFNVEDMNYNWYNHSIKIKK